MANQGPPDPPGDPDRAECLRYVVHDLNNPLTAIRLLAEYARSEAPTAELRQDMVDILEATDLTAALIDGLGSMAREDHVETSASLPLDLASLVRKVAERPALRRFVRLELPDTLRFSGDGSALSRAFTDVLVNARRLADRRLVLVTARQDDEHVEIRVRHEVPAAAESESDPRLPLFAALLEPHGAVPLRREKISVLATGLAYARRTFERHGGIVCFENLDTEGLDLVIKLRR